MKNYFGGLITLLMSILMVLGWSYVSAQESTGDTFTLEEITVTAQKRMENQQKVPIAMEVISGDTIKEVGRNDIDEILNNISSVLIQSSSDGLRVSIRGISNDNAPFGGLSVYTPAVAVNQDSVYTNKNQSNQNMYDIERVEVLFGPQSTIYATGSPGGIVNVITADPKINKYEVSGTIEYGNYDHLHTEGNINAPLNDKAAFRAAFSQSVHDGYLSNGSNDEDIKAARIKALVQPNDSFSFLLTGEISKSAGQGYAGVAPFADQDDVPDPWESASETAGISQDEDIKKMTARMDWDAGDVGTLSIIGSYLKNTSYSAGTAAGFAPPGMVAPTFDSVNVGSGTEKGVEVRMSSSEDFPFKWIVGGNIYRSQDSRTSDSVNVDDSTDIRYNYLDSIDEMNAIYGNITYPVSDKFRATGGIRLTDHKNGTNTVMRPGMMPGELEFVRSDINIFDKPIYKLGFEYDLTDNSMIFSDWSSSYRMNGATVQGSPPEELFAYTAGAKNRFFDNKFQVNVSAYYYDYENYFANGPRFDPPYDSDDDGILDATYEVDGKRFGDAVIYGADIQTTTIITSEDRLNLSVSYIKKYFSDLSWDWPDIINYYGIPDLDYENKDMPQAPNWTVSANYSHNFLLGNGGSLKANLDLRYSSKTCLNWQAEALSVSFEQNPDGTFTGGYVATVLDTGDVRWQEAYHIADINLVYTDPSGKWTLSAYVNNLEDYAVKRFLDQNNNLMIGDPRTYGCVLSLKY